MSTPHNSAKVGEIAKKVIMCGDPLRAKFIAENYLDDAKLVNEVRNVYCYTGSYKGCPVSVMAHGMGVPSMGIYSYELFNDYDVDIIIRVGTAGAYQKEINLKDIVVAVGASTNSNYASQFNLNGIYSAVADYKLLSICEKVCKERGVSANFGSILTSDIFYNEDKDMVKKWADLGVMAVEMETYALYINAAKAHKRAMSMLSISDNLITKKELSSKERQVGFKSMMEVALDTIVEA